MSAKTDNYKEHMYWKNRIQDMICQALKRQINSPILEQYIGCDLEKFRKHIEAQFLSSMTWGNHGRSYGTWQLDHIIGCNNFDLSKEEDRKKCFHYTNFQPLWREEHIKKSIHRLQNIKETNNVQI